MRRAAHLLTLIRIVEPLNESNNRALPRPAASDDGRGLPSGEEEGEVSENHDVRAGRVAEGHFLELYVAMHFVEAPPVCRVLNYRWPLPYHFQQLVAGNLPFAERSKVRKRLPQAPAINELVYIGSCCESRKGSFFLGTDRPPTIAEKIAVKAFPPSVWPFRMNTPAYQNTSAHDIQAIP
jgi:hypothetical protein